MDTNILNPHYRPPLTNPVKNPDSEILSGNTLGKLFLTTTAALLLLKVLLAARLDLYSDEIFYWLESTHLALAYSDLPFMTSLLVWLGSLLEPGSTLAVRSLFLIMGAGIPFLVYWVALPITGRSQALMAALLALCLPLGGSLGLLAVPDVPIIFFGLLSTGLFERALRNDTWLSWVLLGGVVALGLSTHYRFLLYPAAAVLFLIVHKPSWALWKSPKLWLCAVIAMTGLIPILWFNLTHQMASASFYLVERHPWQFRSEGLLHLFIQAALVTPPLYFLIALTLWKMLGKARAEDRHATLLLCLALLNLLVYLLLAPWTDATSTNEHWPLSGYYPALIYAPATLLWLRDWLSRRTSARTARQVVLAIPLLGFVGTLTMLGGVGIQGFQLPAQDLFGRGELSNKMAGWDEFSDYTGQLLQTEFPDQPPVVITDNYYTSAQLEFASVADKPRTIDYRKAENDGRSLQLALWNMGPESLASESGKDAVFIVEDSALNILDGIETVARACGIFQNLHYLDRLSLFNGEKQFTYYAGRLTDPNNTSGTIASPCPYPPRAWIDPPVAGQVMSGVFHIEGWAFKEDIGIRSVALLLNDEEVAEMNYGFNRPDVASSQDVKTDPNSPNLGYAFDLDTTAFANGSYRLAIRLTDERGVQDVYGEREIEIAN